MSSSPSSLTSNKDKLVLVKTDTNSQCLTFKYRLLPSKKQHKALAEICESQRILYNAALQERIDCYRKTGKGRTYIDQYKAITELRQEPKYAAIPANIQRWTVRRLDDAYKGFFRRGGFPRFKGYHRWKSFGFAEFSGIRFDGKTIKFKGLSGGLRVHMHRQLVGKIKSCTFRRDTKGWYVFFQCEVPIQDTVHTGHEIGIDVGLNHFATLSTGEQIPNPRIGRKAERELRRRQRALSRCKKGSNRRKKVKLHLIRCHDKIKNTRTSFLHQQSARLVRDCSRIAVEDLQIKNMVKSKMAKSIHDASWGKFIEFLTYKVAKTGGKVVKVTPHNTSQICSGCGQIVRKELKERTHKCDCGTVLDRDHNAALVILSRGGIVPYQANVAERRKRPDVNMCMAG